MAEVIILGAGMVGISSALALQARGHQVLLADRLGPGRETSYGNAGAIQTEAVEPPAFPRDLSSLLGFALKTSNDVNWHLSRLPEFSSQLLSYWKNSAPQPYAKISALYGALMAKSELAHRPLIAASGQSDLMEASGYRCVFRSTAAFERAAATAERLKASRGVASIIESSQDLARVEPGLQIAMAGAVHYIDVMTCRSPGGLTAAYARLFASRGGKFVHADAQNLAQTDTGWSLRSEEGQHSAEHVVVALGPWSEQFSARFGYKIPMLRKRGYHRHFEVRNGPRASMMDVERGTFIGRMNQGLRLTTGAELARMDDPINWRQIRRSEKSARELFALGAPVEDQPWFGHRPCMADMLPVLGAAPRHRGMWFHFGHGHQGFTAGPASAEVFADLFEGRPSPLSEGLSPLRFG